MSAIREKLLELIPEFEEIKDIELKEKCLNTWELTIE